MTEPTNLVKTQPDETAIYTVKAHDGHGHNDFIGSALEHIKLSATTSFHIGTTIKPDKDIPSGHVWAWISYKDDAGAGNFANSSKVSYVIPAGVWTRLEWTVTVPAGMTVTGKALSIDFLSDETKFQATNFVVYPLTGGRIVRARGTTALVSVSDGAKGDKGDKGATGAKGDAGPQGPKGDAGADGVSPIVSLSKSGSVTTISITDKNGTHTQTVLDGTNGTPGAKGADGRTTYFHVKYSNDGGKTFTANSGETVGTYIGTCTDYNSADPTAVGAYTWAKIKGEIGDSVSSITEEYYLSTSNTSQTGGSWATTPQGYVSGRYYWTRSHIVYKKADGSTYSGYTTPVLANGLNSANSEAKNATTIANGKNKVTYSATANPSGTSGYSAGDIWFNKSTGGIWQFNGSKWNPHQVGTTSITNGAITADKLAVNSVTSDKILAGAINADKIAANAVSLGNLDSTLVTSNILGASVSNLSTWHGTDEFISAATMTYSDDYMTSFSYKGVANWEHAYYIVNGLNNNEQYTVSFEFDAPNNLSTLVIDKYPEQTAGYVPFCIFTEAGFSSRKTSFKSGDLATIQIPPTAGNHRYSVSFTAKSTVIMAFNFGQLADGVQMAFSVGKFKLESGSADTGWVIPRGLYLDSDELRINADSIRTGTLDSININGAVINGGTGNFTGDINATSITAKQKYLIYDTFSNGTKTVGLASMSGTYDAPTLLIGNGFGNVTVALNGSAGQSESVFNVGVNGTGTLMCNTAVATNFIGNWNGLSADFSTYSSGATWIPVFNNMKLQHTLPNDIANLAGCARVCSTVWAKTLDCGLKHGIVLISKYRAYLFWYSGPPSNMGISYKAIYGGDADTTFTELNKTGTGNCWRITVAKNSSITVIGGY